MRASPRTLLAVAAAAGAVACQPPVTFPVSSPDVQTVTIVNFTFMPDRIAVPPGGSVVILNRDDLDHTMTSAAAEGTHVFGGVAGVQFDTGAFRDLRVVTIPADAPVGTVVPFFCRLHATVGRDEGVLEVVRAP